MTAPTFCIRRWVGGIFLHVHIQSVDDQTHCHNCHSSSSRSEFDRTQQSWKENMTALFIIIIITCYQKPGKFCTKRPLINGPRLSLLTLCNDAPIVPISSATEIAAAATAMTMTMACPSRINQPNQTRGSETFLAIAKYCARRETSCDRRQHSHCWWQL